MGLNQEDLGIMVDWKNKLAMLVHTSNQQSRENEAGGSW
jgi:hypothetical protein